MEPVLQVKGLTKDFPGVRALAHVDFDLYPGEVHILAGENGAGKSTLAKCILGVYQPEEGEIYFNKQKVNFKTPKEALNNGIAAVHQELTMIPYLNAAQNIFFNREPVYKGTNIIHQKRMREKTREILRMLDCENIDITKPVKHLGVARQQMIEIAKALSMNPQIIIFDEPTAALSDKEVDSFFKQIEILKKKKIGIIYVSHRMQEFKRIGDRITVLRDGKVVRTLSKGEFSEEELVKQMVGRDISKVYIRSENKQEGEILKVEHLRDLKGKVNDCSLTVNRGEIVGLAGLVGSGRTELARMIFGIDRIKSGSVWVHGKNVTGKRPDALVSEGIGFLPEDRKQLGLAVRAPISWNITSVSLKKLFPHFFIKQTKEEEIAWKYARDLDIATPSIRKLAGTLSGGNQQKVVIAKWLSADTDLIIFDEPTRGIDIGAKMEVYALMDKLAGEGKAILMISSELPELLGMCDRMYIMRNGKIAGHLNRKEFDAGLIGKMMLLGMST